MCVCIGFGIFFVFLVISVWWKCCLIISCGRLVCRIWLFLIGRICRVIIVCVIFLCLSCWCRLLCCFLMSLIFII